MQTQVHRVPAEVSSDRDAVATFGPGNGALIHDVNQLGFWANRLILHIGLDISIVKDYFQFRALFSGQSNRCRFCFLSPGGQILLQTMEKRAADQLKQSRF
jgi:hypothetical protein